MYEDGITVTYRVLSSDSPTFTEGVEQLPGWAAGDPQMALTLYLFGNRDDVDLVDVIDWTVR